MNYYERMTAAGDGERLAYLKGTLEFGQQLSNLRISFPDIDATDWYSITTPQHNSIYGSTIVSAVLNPRPAYLDSFDPVVVALKLFLKQRWIYNKVYTFVNPNEQPLPCPVGSLPVAVGFLVQVYGRPADEDLSRYQCLYFQHPEHDVVQSWANKSLPQGAYSTYYSATFDTLDGNRLRRMKAYCYDEQNGTSDWEVAWNRTATARGVLGDFLGSN